MSLKQRFTLALAIGLCAAAVGCSSSQWDKNEFSGTEKDGKIYVFVRGSGAHQRWEQSGTLPSTAVTFSGPNAPNGQTLIAENENILRQYIGEKRYQEWKSTQPQTNLSPRINSPGIGL